MAAPAISKKPHLTAGFAAFGLYLQEAAMSQRDIRSRLEGALEDRYRGTGTWCYVIDIFGDDQSGDVIYYCEGMLCKSAYTCSASGATIADDMVEVVPLTTYEEKGSAAAGQVMEAGRRNSARDLKQLQAIHDSAVGLGAACATRE